MQSVIKVSLCGFGLLFLASCSTVPRQDAPVVDIVDRSEGSSGSIKPAPVSNPIVVAGLQKDATELNRAGESAKAAAVLERAIRIQPRNPRLWQQLAEVRFSQKQYRQAESLALRSNQYAARAPDIRRTNWLLIANARQQTGNLKGAKAARLQADKLDNR